MSGSLGGAPVSQTESRGESFVPEAFARGLVVSRPTLARLETADQNVTLDTLERVSRRLRCEPGQLLSPLK